MSVRLFVLVAAALVCGVAVAPSRPPDATVARTQLLGRSVRGSPIRVLERGDADGGATTLVVGCIHGNEPAGIAIAEQLESLPIPPETTLWVVEDSNPDGVRAGTRTNADGVDLNRNFPWRWYRHGAPGDLHYSGPRPLSEPESRLLAGLVRDARPKITIWFHQPLGVVDESGGDPRIEATFARLVGLPLRRLPRYPGGVTNWQNASFPGTTAFVVELPAGSLSPEAVRRYAEGVVALASGRRS